MTWQSATAPPRQTTAAHLSPSAPAIPTELRPPPAPRFPASSWSPPEYCVPGSSAAPPLPDSASAECLPGSPPTADRKPGSSLGAPQTSGAPPEPAFRPAPRPATPQTRCTPARFGSRYSLLACFLLRESNRASSILPRLIRDFTVPSGTRSTTAISL